LLDTDDGVRYWAAVGFQAGQHLAAADRHCLLSAVRDRSPVVRIEAAAALARHDDAEVALPILMAALEDASPEIVLHASRALELLGPIARPARQKMREALTIARERETAGDVIAMFIRFSLESALSQ
jgi:HEAT repeat protein